MKTFTCGEKISGLFVSLIGLLGVILVIFSKDVYTKAKVEKVTWDMKK